MTYYCNYLIIYSLRHLHSLIHLLITHLLNILLFRYTETLFPPSAQHYVQ